MSAFVLSFILGGTAFALGVVTANDENNTDAKREPVRDNPAPVAVEDIPPGEHFPDPAVFISWGPYRDVRNPMSKGGFTVLVGWGCYLLSPSVVLFACVMAGLMHLFVVFFEEPRLERRFGQSYLDYESGVGRRLPTRRTLAGVV